MEKGKITQISEDMDFSGEIIYDDIIQIDGKVNGVIKSKGKVIITQTAEVKGDIYSETLEILGTLQGNVHEASFIHLKPTARVHGDLFSKEVQIDRGAHLFGSMSMITND